MFNRQPFNRGKFNSSSIESLGASGIALMVLGAMSTQATKIINANGITSLKMGTASDGTIVKFNKGNTDLVMGSHADGTKRFIVVGNIANVVMTTNAEQALSGEEVINLNGLVLKPNDELVINTCDMTVTLNGQNAMQYFSSDSDFISLLNGENSIEYNDTSPSRKIAFDVIWKDRWL
ncbi:MAG TPA: hypothetical protein GX707_06425 [Epulopiscium sp.]|nr:hypothetical protein [Candidatus Epulonipiscium sp.]